MYYDNSLGWLTQHLYQIIHIFWQVCRVTPAWATKSRTAQVKSVANNNDCLEGIARAVWTDVNFFRTDDNVFRTDSPSHSNGCKFFFAQIARAMRTDANFFAQLARAVWMANAWHKHGYLCQNGKPWGTFSCERSHVRFWSPVAPWQS